jgi:hypothetical protein
MPEQEDDQVIEKYCYNDPEWDNIDGRRFDTGKNLTAVGRGNRTDL